MKKLILLILPLAFISCMKQEQPDLSDLTLWYQQPAEDWTEALPVGNGRLGAMVYGTVAREQIQFNEETLWTGEPHDYSHKGASKYLGEIRKLLFDGKQDEAEELAMNEFMSVPLKQKSYQAFGDMYLDFPGHENYSDYKRELDLAQAICKTSYSVDGVGFTREVIASYPDQIIAIHLKSDKKKQLNFSCKMGSPHGKVFLINENKQQKLFVQVLDGALFGEARAGFQTDGQLIQTGNSTEIREASYATILLSASTNFVNYQDVSKDPSVELDKVFTALGQRTFGEIKEDHILDHKELFERFRIDFGSNGRDTLPMDKRLVAFSEDPVDPSLIALYTQYGRYLMIASSRPGTYPANLQGIWNDSNKPAWDSKYTVNINTEMNYWPVEVSNLSECHDPLFSLIEECAETGAITAREHYNCNGWILHHNTDIWRGTAPINNSNHGMWMSGSGWLCMHLWEHYLFTQDIDFLRDRAYPLMKEAARFYSEFLIEDPRSGWLISTPSNSPENGGMVAGPTMDHQVIRSLFRACVESGKILGVDQEFNQKLEEMIPKIAPNQIGKHGQLQEWMEDIDDPGNHHRHISHLWGVHPGNDINWEETPDLMNAAIQSLKFRGDEGTGWSLAWKINFWSRFRDGNYAYELIKLVFRPAWMKDSENRRGGSYKNLFDAHPPFQIDGNFGAAAGIIEMLIQSQSGYIHLLPALPDLLPEGSLSGVCARGGFVLDFDWSNGQVDKVVVLSKAGRNCLLKLNGKSIEFETTMNSRYQINAEGEISIR